MSDAAVSSAENPSAWRRPWLLGAVIAAVTILAYIPAMRGGFSWDDAELLTGNPMIHARDGLRRFWLTRQAADYFPLMSSVLWVEWRLWGDHPGGYHVVNVLLHAAGAVCLWRVLRRLRVPGAWLAGALFAVHPVAVASAAWISELKNTLSMVLYLLSLLAYLTYDERDGRSGGWYFLAMGLFLLALLAKTSVVMLPVVVLLCAWWRRGAISRKDVARSVPFFALALALGLVTIWFQARSAMAGGPVRVEGFASRLAVAGWIVWFDLFKLLVPVGLCVIYPRWSVADSSAAVYLPLALLAAGMAWLWMRRRSWGRAPLFATAYFVITLLPVLGFLDMSFMRYAFAADHLQYAAMIGVVAFVAGVLAKAGSLIGSRGGMGMLAAAAPVALLGFLTCGRAALYADDQRLWQDNLDKNPSSWAAWTNLGVTKRRAGRFAEAMQCFDRAIELKNDCADTYVNRGFLFASMGRRDLALRDYGQAIELNPAWPLPYGFRGKVYDDAGQFAAAERDYDKVIALAPDYAITYYVNRGNLRARTGRLDDAIRDYDCALALEPDFAEIYCDRGDAYDDARRFAEALRDYDKAIALKPSLADAYNDRATAYYHMGEYGKAVADLERCEKLNGTVDPGFREALMQAAGRAK
jgi:tetratricopeptide (TPR) repeat protein